MIPYLLLALFCSLLSAVSQTLLKKSAQRVYASKWREYLNPLVAGGYALLGCAMLLMLVCYRHLGYLETVVLEPAGYLMVFLIGSRVFGEAVTLRKIAGMALIIAGILVFHLLP